MSERTVTNVAATKEGMTVGDLEVFLQDCHEAGLPGDAHLQVLAGLRGQVKRITATGATA